MYGRPPTGSLANRPSSRSGNTATWGNRGAPGAGAGSIGASGVPPRTGMPGPAMSRAGRPGTGMRGASGFQVVDRPMTQQGLGGIKSTSMGPGRVIQDKTYFQSELRQRITAIHTEINRLNTEASRIERENANNATFEKRADALAEELRELQGQLGDFNVLVDKLHTDTELDDMERWYNQLKIKNQRESSVMDDIFAQRQNKENSIREVDAHIEEERKKAERHIEQLDPERKRKYLTMKEQNAKYLAEIAKKQMELDEINRKCQGFQDTLKTDPVKQKALGLQEKLNELRGKKKELEESLRAMEVDSGPQEKARLLEQVKEDNQETSAMERKISELEEQSHRLKEQISQLDMELDSHQVEKNAKYEELLKRDREMQAFIDSFEVKRKEAMDRNTMTEKSITDLLDRIRQAVAKYDAAAMPSPENYRDLQGDLKFKEKEMKNSETTFEALAIERDRRLRDLEKVNQLEVKLTAELGHLKSKIAKLTDELAKVSNIDQVKKDAEATKKKNAADRETLQRQRDQLRAHVQLLSAKYDAKKQSLQDNETYAQLGALEQRLRHHESNNFHLRDYIQAKTMESDYKPVEQDVMGLMDEVNGQLIKLMSLPPAR